MTPFEPNETLTIIGFIALLAIVIFNLGKIILMNDKPKE